ncbi:trypsin-like peptidase domain-containing protein [Streptomyces sp. NPDC059165]|uniref:trypsin-like peptidase domain-containing protein n=1 Tax=Streptomyces sp. NPDC059165 TaxID=3346751 RepID=UPI0036B35690
MARGDLATLVRICDRAGRPRGSGFVADDSGTVVTSHEAVAGLSGPEVHAARGDRTSHVGADDVTLLPEVDLALVRTRGLGVRPLPIVARRDVETGAYVCVAARGWREARVLGVTDVTYADAGRHHHLGGALELTIGTDGSDALRLGGTTGAPVLDAATGAVVAVLGAALHGNRAAAGFAVPLRAAAARDPHGPLAELLERNASDAPGFGPDLNLAGALRLAAVSTGPPQDPPAVERTAISGRLTSFAASDALVLGMTGDPGSGRTTALRSFAARRADGTAPAPTVLLRGADLYAADGSLADAVARILARASRIAADGDETCATPERIAHLARDHDRRLLVLLDSPEEMPPGLAARLADWTGATAHWLRHCDARLVVACRPEHWEQAAALYPEGVLHRPGGNAPGEPHRPALHLGPLTGAEAAQLRGQYGLPPGSLAERDSHDPLVLRLLAEVREALPGDVAGQPGRDEVFGAYLDLACLRAAERIASAAGRGTLATPVRCLAARIAGRVHEAARRCLGSGQGRLDRECFEELFPWRPGWASAVLAEGLLAPAGGGYRFAHEGLADWVQAAHLDLDGALDSLVHRAHPAEPYEAEEAGQPDEGAQPGDRWTPRVPRHRLGPVVQALLLLGRRSGAAELGHRLKALVDALPALDAQGADGSGVDGPAGGPPGAGEARWWAVRLLRESLLRLPDARPHLGVLQALADCVSHCFAQRGDTGGPTLRDDFGPGFWQRLRLTEADRIDLFRRLIPADGVPRTRVPGGEATRPRYLDAVAERLARAPRSVQPLLCRWFTDDRPLPTGPAADVRPTVAGAAQALLYARRTLAPDDLCEALISTAHPRAGELLAALAEDETSAVCRAVDRWAHDDARQGRRAAAASYGWAAAHHATGTTDRELLRYAAVALLARPADTALHGQALALLVLDPRTRSRYLARALALYRSGDRGLPASALAAALPTHPEQVFESFRDRLLEPGDGAREVFRALAGIGAPDLAERAVGLVREYADLRPDAAAHAAVFVDRALERGTAARVVLLPLISCLLRGRPETARGALAEVLAAPGPTASRPLRAELLDLLLEYEQYEGSGLDVLDAVVRTAALGWARQPESRTRELVHRAGLLLVRTPEGANRFDSRLVELARRFPGFGSLVAVWLAEAPHDWSLVVGPSTRRTVEALRSPMPMRTDDLGHGSLRPA